MSSIYALFPFLGIALTVCLIIYFLVWKKTTVKTPKKPRKTTKATAPPTHTPTPKTNYEPPAEKEGFVGQNNPVPANWNPTIPTWLRASVIFTRTANDSYYTNYAATNLQPNPELVALVNSLPVAPPSLPNFGAQLGTFDSSTITTIPWDADNLDSLQSDIVWGSVSRQASASIFMKVYQQNLLSDAANLQVGESNMQYRSPLLAVSADSPAEAVLLQTVDAVAGIAGQMALDAAGERIAKKIASIKTQNLAKELNRLTDLKASKGALSVDESAKLNRLLSSGDDVIGEAKNLARQQKLATGAALDAVEEAQDAAYRASKLAKQGKGIKMFKQLGGVITKVMDRVGLSTALKLGASKAKAFANAIKDLAKGIYTKTLARVLPKMGIMKAITVFINVMLGTAATCAAVTFGACAAPMAPVFILAAAWNVLDAICMAVMIMLQILLPPLLDKGLENGGVCNGGVPLDQLISDEALYFIFTTFIPIGGVLDAFGPYLCYNSDGSAHFKEGLYIPPYFSDASLSLYKHIYPPSENPRGDSTSYSDPDKSIPPGWKITAGIAREPCLPGTWTSSDVDALCNISTYVPRTYPKRSYVPKTVVKNSWVPPTTPKYSAIATRFRDKVRDVKVPRYSRCGPGLRDTDLTGGNIGDCWEDLQCNTRCSGDWNPTTWRCNTNCSGCGCVKTWSFQRAYCPDIGNIQYDNYLSLCRQKCEQFGPGFSQVLPTDLFCKGTCIGSGADEETDWGIGCTGKYDSFCRDKDVPDLKGFKGRFLGGGTMVAGVCWEKCPAGDVDVGALCRKSCGSAKDVAGVCWDNCASGYSDQGALCRQDCDASAPNDVAGVCWGGCGNDIDVGALCRERCRSGFHEVAGVCWGDIGTYARKMMIPKSIKTYDPGFQPPRNLSDVRLPWCNFADPEMLRRMAQFYYDQSTLNPVILDDERISYEYIVQFYGVIASSELSCDVACQMKTVKFDPVTGDRYEESYGTTYPDDPGNEVSYRRFYFIQISDTTAATLAAAAATDPTKRAIPPDGQGFFTVTGCTNSDYTAPDAMNKSTDPGVDPLISLPKVYEVRDKKAGQSQFSMKDFATSAATVGIATAIGMGTGKGGVAGQAAGGVAGGMAGEAVSGVITKAFNQQAAVGAEARNEVVAIPAPNGETIFNVVTNNDNYNINYGPIYEQVAMSQKGYVPQINFCGKINTTSLLCSHQFILRDTIDQYHQQNPAKRIKTVNIIEPRGKDGCYYKWNTVSFDPATRQEGAATNVEEVVRQYKITDQSTCVFSPTNTFVTDMSKYPIRSYVDMLTGTTKYPTRNVQSTATVQGRFIRIRPSQTGDGYLRISQIAVFDPTGENLAADRPVYATNTVAGSGAPNLIVDGTMGARSGAANVWSGGNNTQTTYLDIDLGKNYFISNVLYFGMLDTPSSASDQGVRIQVLFANGATEAPVKELITSEITQVQNVDFGTKMILPTLPVQPFVVPTPLPVEVNLGTGCPSRCQDRDQINAMVTSYNKANPAAQIIKVTKAVSSTPTRCDYAADIVRTVGTKKAVANEVVSMTATLASNTTPPNAAIYGQFIRIKPNAANALQLSQVAVMNVAGINVAQGKPTFSSTNNKVSRFPAKYGVSALITDGTLSVRAAPKIWSNDITGTQVSSTDYIEIDLGRSFDIVSIVVYGVAQAAYDGVTVAILNSDDSTANPIYSTTLAPTAGQTTFTVSNFNKCTFTFSPLTSPISYIQDNTPSLNAVDTSGGVLSFQAISNSIVNVFNTIVNPIKALNPLGNLGGNITAADITVNNVLNAAGAGTQLQGCPNTKCSDPAVLTAIMNRYNVDNGNVTTQYGAETNKMDKVSKAGAAGPNACDVLFTNLYSSYEDYLYPPTETQTSTMVRRFIMTNTGNCAMQVADGAKSVLDVSMNAIGIIPSSSALSKPFTATPCQVNCRDPALLASIKTMLNSQMAVSNVNGQTIPNFTSVIQSFNNGSSMCEYMMEKDVTTKNARTYKTTTETGLSTYVRATFTPNAGKCSFTLKTVEEFDPDAITTTTDNITGIATAYINSIQVEVPFLYNYDNTTPSSLVNETALNL